MDAKTVAAIKLGVRRLSLSNAYQEKAKDNRVSELQMKVLNPTTTAEDMAKLYDELPDGRTFKFVTNPDTGRLMPLSVAEDGTKTPVAFKEGFEYLNHFKQFTVGMMHDPAMVMALMDKHQANLAAQAKQAYTEAS